MTNHRKAIRAFRAHVTLMKMQKPSRKMLPQILNLLDGVLIILDENEGSDSLLEAVEQIAKKQKKEKHVAK